jgi:hypothetical protein
LPRMIRILATLLFLCHSVAHADELRRSGFFGIAAAAPPAGAQGVLVRDLVDGGSAKEAGVQRDDLIQRVDGRNVVDAAGFVAMARALRAGDVASVDLIRAGREVTVRVPVKPRPYEKAPGLEIAYDSVAVSDHLRRTLLTLPPQASGRLPAVLFVTGIGCFSQELADPEDGVARLLHGLTRAGFVTMRVENRAPATARVHPATHQKRTCGRRSRVMSRDCARSRNIPAWTRTTSSSWA